VVGLRCLVKPQQGLEGPEGCDFGLGARTMVLIAPAFGEVWNQKLGKFLHAIFLITIKEVKQDLHLTCWL